MKNVNEKIKLMLIFMISAFFVTAIIPGEVVGEYDKVILEIDEHVLAAESVILRQVKNMANRGSIGIDPTDDAQVVEGSPDNNYGSATYLYVQSASSGASTYQDERAWIKFDISGSIPSGAVINSAKLQMYCWKAQGQNMNTSVHGSIDDSWSESGITWNNQSSYESVLDSIILVVGETYVWKEWNVTSFVQGEWADDKITSFVVKPTVEDSPTAKTFSFDSKEYSSGTYAPILQVDYQTQPGQPVVSDIPDQFIELGNSFSPIALDDYVDDSDHQDDEITWTYSGNINLTVDIDPTTRIATITAPSSEWVGQETITFRATDPELLWDEDSATFTVTPWVETSTSPYIHSYAVGVVCAGEYVILANGETSGSSKIMKYNISSDLWATFSNPPYHFKNSVAMEWDKADYVYTLFGGSYSDCRNQARHYFSRFNINSNSWENLPDSPWYQGPGDAITWVKFGDNEYIYALLGSSSCSGAPWEYPGPPYPEGVQFRRYNITGNIWDQNLTPIPYGSDDGADLIWTGGDYIYAFPGAYNEGLPKTEERHFLRYSISGDSWMELAMTPYNADGGVDDGGSLLYPGYGGYIYALKGGDDGAGGGGSPGDDFWRYSVISDDWEILPSIPAGVGDQNGHRLGLSDGNIYCWRGCFGDGTLWAYPLDILIDGYCNDTGGIPVDLVTVDVVNLDTADKLQADISGNYYSLSLTPGVDVDAGETLRVIARDDINYVNVTDYLVTSDDISNGFIHTDLIMDIYYKDLTNFPFYEAEDITRDENQMTGPAVLQMILNYMYWNRSVYAQPQMVFDDQGALYDEAIVNNSNVSLGYLDTRGMWHTLQNNLPGDYSEYGYNFGMYHNADADVMLAIIATWIDYEVINHKSGYPLSVPVAIPAYGGYTNWMAVRGIHTNISAYPLPPAIEIEGFWVNDPLASGIGENTYKTATEFIDTYYKPLTGIAAVDEFYSEYVAVCEPPVNADPIEFEEVTLTYADYSEFSIEDKQLELNVLRRGKHIKPIHLLDWKTKADVAAQAAVEKILTIADKKIKFNLYDVYPVYSQVDGVDNYCLVVYDCGEFGTLVVRLGKGRFLEFSHAPNEKVGHYMKSLFGRGRVPLMFNDKCQDPYHPTQRTIIQPISSLTELKLVYP